jgi:hypothetical protein
MVSCSDEFLEQTPEQSLSIDDAVRDLTSLRAAVNGVYSNFQDANIYGWDLPLIPDLRGDNALISSNNAGRFLDFDQFALNDQNGRAEDEWVDMYEVIVNTSNIINRVPDGTFLSTEQEEVDQLLGEAYTQRALTYWNLVRLFATPYSANNGASPGVPFNNEGTTGNLATPPRESVATTYAQIISDLQAAIPLMTQNVNGRINKETAQAILAKVYLYQEEWQSAKDQADAVVNSGRYSIYQDSAAWFGSWGSNFGSEDIFALVNNEADNFGTNSIGGIIDQDGYGDALATEDLFEAYDDSDYRRSFMIRGNRVGGEDNVLFPEGKYPRGETGEDYIKIMRYSDVLLIRAEALAELGDEEGARADLDAVASTRIQDYSPSTATGDDLIEEILHQRRLEFAFEGDRVYDLMRRQRTWTTYSAFDTIQISWDDDQLINPIPRLELDNNPNITENNPGY